MFYTIKTALETTRCISTTNGVTHTRTHTNTHTHRDRHIHIHCFLVYTGVKIVNAAPSQAIRYSQRVSGLHNLVLSMWTNEIPLDKESITQIESFNAYWAHEVSGWLSLMAYLGHRCPYKSCNHNLYIGSSILSHTDNTQFVDRSQWTLQQSLKKLNEKQMQQDEGTRQVDLSFETVKLHQFARYMYLLTLA